MCICSTAWLSWFGRAFTAAVAALFCCAAVFADTFTWSSTATTSSWNLASNWINNSKPVSANTTDVLFADSTQFALVQDIANPPLTLRGLWFYDKLYTLTGNGLVFDGASAAIYNYTTTSIFNHITLASTISYEGTGDLTINNTIDGAGGFIKNGTGPVIFKAFNLYNGDTVVNAGQIVFDHEQPLLFTTAILNTNNGLNFNGRAAVLGNLAGAGNLNVGAAPIIVGNNNSSQTYSGQLSATTGGIEKRGGGTWTLTGAGSSLSRFSVTQGRAILSGGNLTLTSTIIGPSRALTVGNTGSANLDVFAGAVLNSSAGGAGNALIRGSTSGGAPSLATLTVAGPGSRWDAGTIDIGGTVNAQGSLIADNGGVINATDIFVGKPAGGSLLIQNGGIVNATHLNVSSDPADPVPTVALRSGGQSVATETILATPTGSIDIDRATLHTAMLTSIARNGSITLRDPIGASALVIDGTSAAATYTGAISGAGGITKNGTSTQTLAGQNNYTGPTTVNGGVLVMSNGSSASYTANGTGHLTPTFGDFGHSSFRVSGGGTIQYPPIVIGGFIRGSDGLHDLKQVLSFNGTTFAVDTALTQDNPLALNNVTNSGNFTNKNSLTWDGGVNTSAGTFTVNSEALVTSFENNGVIAIHRRGLLVNSNTPLVSGGGGLINIDEQGRLELVSSELHLRGSLLVNNGVVKGTVNVHFNGLATGSGEFGEVRLFENGRFAPGKSANPAVFGPAAVPVAVGASFSPASTLAVEIGGRSAGADFDQVNVAGAAALAGTLEITTTNNFAPAVLDAFKVLSFDVRQGAFSKYVGTDTGNGLAYAPIYGNADLSLIATIPGDASLDGKVDFVDLVRIAQNYNRSVSGVTDSWWLLGDFTYDGVVGFNDLVILAQHYGQSAVPASDAFAPEFASQWAAARDVASVPEPSLAGLLLLPFMMRRRRK